MNFLDIRDRLAAGLDATQEIAPELFDILPVRLVELCLFVNRFAAIHGIERPSVVPAHVECSFSSVEVAPYVLALLSRVARKLAMLPNHVHLLELERRDLVIWCIRA